MNGALDLAPDNISLFRSQRNDAFTTESQIPHKATSFITIKQEDSEECEVNDYFNDLCDCIFIKDETAFITAADFALNMLDFIYMKEIESQTNDTSLKIYKLIRASGFSVYKDTKSLTASRLWVNFKQFICDKYAVEFKNKLVNKKAIKCFVGLSIRSFNQIMELEEQSNEPCYQTEDNNNFELE